MFFEINLSLLNLYGCRYLNELIVNAGHIDIYGFEPQIIQKFGIDQCTLKDIFNSGFMNPRKEFTSPLILKGKLNSDHFSY